MGNFCSEVEDATDTGYDPAQEDFLSQYKMRVHACTDPIARSSVFRFIESEYKNEFGSECPDLHRFYHTS